MITIKEQAGHVVAADAQASAAAIDSALLQQVRLCASILETTGASHMPMVATQPLLASIAAGFTKFVDGRAEMTAAMHELIVIQGKSNLAEVSFGCPGGPVMAAPAPALERVD